MPLSFPVHGALPHDDGVTFRVWAPAANTVTLELDDDVTFEDIMYELHVLQKIERGLDDAEQGRVTPHADVDNRLSEWLK